MLTSEKKFRTKCPYCKGKLVVVLDHISLNGKATKEFEQYYRCEDCSKEHYSPDQYVERVEKIKRLKEKKPRVV